MTRTKPDAPQEPTFPELMTMAELAILLRRTRSGVDKLRARDPSFPKPFKDGIDSRARVYFVSAEVDAWIREKLEGRAEKSD